MKNKLIFCLFFLFLAAPAVTFPFVKDHIDSENHENRRFAEKPDLSFGTLASFPKQFDDYFNDHLPYKNQLVMANTMKNDFLGVGTTMMEYMTSSMVIRGKDNWKSSSLLMIICATTSMKKGSLPKLQKGM